MADDAFAFAFLSLPLLAPRRRFGSGADDAVDADADDADTVALRTNDWPPMILFGALPPWPFPEFSKLDSAFEVGRLSRLLCFGALLPPAEAILMVLLEDDFFAFFDFFG